MGSFDSAGHSLREWSAALLKMTKYSYGQDDKIMVEMTDFLTLKITILESLSFMADRTLRRLTSSKGAQCVDPPACSLRRCGWTRKRAGRKARCGRSRR